MVRAEIERDIDIDVALLLVRDDLREGLTEKSGMNHEASAM